MIEEVFSPANFPYVVMVACGYFTVMMIAGLVFIKKLQKANLALKTQCAVLQLKLDDYAKDTGRIAQRIESTDCEDQVPFAEEFIPTGSVTVI